MMKFAYVEFFNLNINVLHANLAEFLWKLHSIWERSIFMPLFDA